MNFRNNDTIKWLLCSAAMCTALTVCSQTVVKGKVSSSTGTALGNVSVTASLPRSKSVIAFAITSADGSYQLTVSWGIDSIQVKASLLGFTTDEQIIPNKTQLRNFVLIPTAIELKEVIVKNMPIKSNKDTISYAVQPFAGKEDRSIADVIKKMPGMEVQDNGTILYQGKAIQAFLVNGLDLLEGRYSLASNNLPFDAVRNVQVIENNQRVKVLDSLVFSDRTTLNIQLKKFLTTGTGSVAAGAAPLLWDVNLTPITYNKTVHVINAYQSNNLGYDRTSQLRVLTNDNILNAQLRQNPPLITIDQVSPPPFDQQYWLNNNQHLVTTNWLKELKKGFQLKFNASYSTDYQQRYGTASTQIITPGQTVLINESKENGLNKNIFKAGFIAEENSKRVYFKNIFNFECENNKGIANLVNGGRKIYETLGGEPQSFTNNASLITAIGKQLVSINSMISYNKANQLFSVTPGLYDSAFHNGKSYDKVTQYVLTKNLQAEHYLGFVKGFGHFTIAPKLGFEVGQQTLVSHLFTTDSTVTTELGTDFRNYLSLFKTNAYQEIYTQYRNNNITGAFTLRTSEQKYKFENRADQNARIVNRVLVEPRAQLNIKIRQQYELVVSGGIDNNFGELSQMYQSYILKSYRSLQRLNTALPENRNFSASVFLNYKETLKGIFFSLGFSANRYQKNLVYANHVEKDGSVSVQSFEKNNTQENQVVSGTLSKYFAAIKTIVKLNTKFSSGTSEQFVNNQLILIGSRVSSTGININNSFFKHLTFEYSLSLQSVHNDFNAAKTNYVKVQQHLFKLNVFPVTGHLFSLASRYYFNNQNTKPNLQFINLQYRFSVPGRKIDFELQCNNLLNSAYFTNTYTKDFFIYENSFQMRQRNILACVRFTF